MRFFDADFRKFTKVDFPVPAGPSINKLELVRSIVLNAAIWVSFKMGFMVFIVLTSLHNMNKIKNK